MLRPWKKGEKEKAGGFLQYHSSTRRKAYSQKRFNILKGFIVIAFPDTLNRRLQLSTGHITLEGYVKKAMSRRRFITKTSHHYKYWQLETDKNISEKCALYSQSASSWKNIFYNLISRLLASRRGLV